MKPHICRVCGAPLDGLGEWLSRHKVCSYECYGEAGADSSPPANAHKWPGFLSLADDMSGEPTHWVPGLRTREFEHDGEGVVFFQILPYENEREPWFAYPKEVVRDEI